MTGTSASRRQSGYLIGLGLALGLLLPTTGFTAVEALPGPHAQIDNVQVDSGKARTEVRGTVRLLPSPLPRSNPGRIVLEAVAQGRTLARSEATMYRIVTADRRARLFGFRAVLPMERRTDMRLRIHRLPAGK